MKKILIGLLLTLPVQAYAIMLPEKIYQGDLVYGKLEKGEQVFMGEKQLPAMFDTFIFAVGRDAPETLTLNVKKDGNVKSYPVQILPYDWEVEYVQGVPKKTVYPSAWEKSRIARDKARITEARKTKTPNTFPMCFQTPVKGRHSGLFGKKRFYNGVPGNPHGGLDIAAPKGTEVKTIADGVVTLSEKSLFYTGGTVIIHHGSGVYSSYSHLSALDAKVGDNVKQGDVIGFVGSEGRATGPHLHLTLMVDNVRVDPARVLKDVCP